MKLRFYEQQLQLKIGNLTIIFFIYALQYTLGKTDTINVKIIVRFIETFTFLT